METLTKLISIFTNEGVEREVLPLPPNYQLFPSPTGGSSFTYVGMEDAGRFDPSLEGDGEGRMVQATWSTDGLHFLVIWHLGGEEYRLCVYHVESLALFYQRAMSLFAERDVGCTMAGNYLMIKTKDRFYIKHLLSEDGMEEVIVPINWYARILQYGINTRGYYYYAGYTILDTQYEEELLASSKPDWFVTGLCWRPSPGEIMHMNRHWMEVGGRVFYGVWISEDYFFAHTMQFSEDEETYIQTVKRISMDDPSRLRLESQFDPSWSIPLEGSDVDRMTRPFSLRQTNRLSLWTLPTSGILLGGRVFEEDEEDDYVYAWWRISTESEELVRYSFPRESPIYSISLNPNGCISIYHRDLVGSMIHRIRVYPTCYVSRAQDALVHAILEKMTGRRLGQLSS